MDGSEEFVLFEVGIFRGESGIDYGCLVCDFFRCCIFEGYLYKAYGRYDIDSVVVSKLPELIHEAKKDLDQVGLVSTVIGHVRDRNFHPMLVFTTDEELEIVQKAARRIVHRAIETVDGTCLLLCLLFSSQTLALGLTLVDEKCQGCCCITSVFIWVALKVRGGRQLYYLILFVLKRCQRFDGAIEEGFLLYHYII